ncbi:FAD-dependent oxidoreductase [Streptomyces sp. NPDC006872]|uniref:NAD(P)/FAD-dependent oxidoreductase n=1 Tax=Streptomyces sp. NPDC006872 TaxID=3155720 RepID=UPI003406B849
MDKSALSHWWRKMELRNGGPILPRAPLDGDREADVVIVGAGYTGLWIALELLREAPETDVVVLDAKVAGYGASGRNGGAVIAQLNGSRDYWVRRGGGPDGAIRMERAVQGAVEEVGAAVEREGIDCGYGKNGVLMVARTPLEQHRFRQGIEEDRAYGFGPEDSRYLDRDEVNERINVAGALGARFSAHCASVDGGALARGLAEAVEKHGGAVYEGTPVFRISPHKAVTASGTVHAKYVIRATEAYTESMDGQHGQIVPVHTSMLATEVLDDAIIEQLRWNGHEALLAEHPFLHLQFTADNRITIGGDDPQIPYRWRSAPNPDAPASPKAYEHYRRELVKLFPCLEGVQIADSWQGVFGTNRNWAPSVGLNVATGMGHAGGYVGEGLAAANLAGRTMRDLILGRDSELTGLPWTNVTARRWEPEPLRWIGAGLIWAARAVGDRNEVRTGKSSTLVGLANRAAGFTGHLG